MFMEDELMEGLFDSPELDAQQTETSLTNQTTDSDDFFNDSLEESKNPLIDELLKLRGFNDSKLTIIDEDNLEKEISFWDLSKEEQLLVLQDNTETESNDLDDQEISFLNQLRENNLSIENFLENYRNEILNEVSNQEKTYEIDGLTDQELYVLDLKAKYGFTQEELEAELEKELKNEELFNKKASKLREEYKQLEDQFNENKRLELEQQESQDYNEFVDTMTNVAINTPDWHGVESDDNEKEEVLASILDLGNDGESEFYKNIKDPNVLYQAAWYLKYGEAAIEAIKNAYETKISKLEQQITGKKTNPVIIKQQGSQIKSIHDLK